MNKAGGLIKSLMIKIRSWTEFSRGGFSINLRCLSRIYLTPALLLGKERGEVLYLMLVENRFDLIDFLFINSPKIY